MEESTESTNPLYESLKKRGIANTSLNLYWRNLTKLNGDKQPTDLKFLKNIKKVTEQIAKLKPTTQRTYIISICSLLKTQPNNEALYKKYYALLSNYNKDLAVRNQKSETQQENWISQDEVKQIYDTLTTQVQPFLSKRKLTATEYNQLLEWVVLSLYTLQPPRRNKDYQLCYIVKKLPTEMDMSRNYLDMSGKFAFNNYKTKGTYHTQTIDASPELMRNIKAYLKFHPMKKGGDMQLLVNYDGKPLSAVNSITRILNKIFHRKIGASMLRNIYLTDKYGKKMEEMKADANDMGTSSNTIQQNYLKISDAP